MRIKPILACAAGALLLAGCAAAPVERAPTRPELSGQLTQAASAAAVSQARVLDAAQAAAAVESAEPAVYVVKTVRRGYVTTVYYSDGTVTTRM